MMTYAEACIRERQENVTEDFIRGAVWAIMKVYELVPYDRTKSYKERIDMILDLEKTFPDYIAAEKESFEFNRGATHGLESFALRVAKDEHLDYGDRLTIIGSYGVDYIAEEEDALQMYQEEFPEGEEKEISIQNITQKLEWARNIEKNKSLVVFYRLFSNLLRMTLPFCYLLSVALAATLTSDLESLQLVVKPIFFTTILFVLNNGIVDNLCSKINSFSHFSKMFTK